MSHGWSIVYEKAVRDDGTLFFPERLTPKFLEEARRTMGSYLFANQYQNEIIPDSEKRFKKHWLKYFTVLPDDVYTFGFIDPAIGQKDRHDYTAILIVSVDQDANWYVRVANRERLTPTQIVGKAFEIQKEFGLRALGIEAQAYQEALLYFSDEEMRKRQTVIPLYGIKRSSEDHKTTRILSLVPRFEWGRIFLSQGLTDLEYEYNLFPKATHDDLMDALQSIEEIVSYPPRREDKPIEKPHSASDPSYERWFIQQKYRAAQRGSEGADAAD